MSYDLRPLSFAEILDRSSRILADNAVSLIGISAIVWIPYNLLVALGKSVKHAGALLLIVAVPLLSAALIGAIAEIYLDRPVTIARAYKSAWSILLPCLGTCLLLYVPFVLGALLSIVLLGKIATAAEVTGVGLVVLECIILMPLGLYLLTRWSLFALVMILERRFGLSALRRSRDLVEGAWWRTFGIIWIVPFIVLGLTGALHLLWSSLPKSGVILSGLASSVTSAYTTSVGVVYYFDRRCRIGDFERGLFAEQIRGEGVPGRVSVAGDDPSLG